MNYNIEHEITYNTEVLQSNLCDYNDAYILVTDNFNVRAAPKIRELFKKCAPFTKYIPKIDGKTIDDAEDLDLVMSMYNLI